MRKRTQLHPQTAVALMHSVHCAELGSFDGTTDAEAKWVQVAREGMFLGYAGGAKPFMLTRETMKQAVDNLRAHPGFQAGANGEGEVDLIPWDYNHASEQDPVTGSLPLTGAPAQGWTRDLRLDEVPGGKAKLMALTRFIEPARSYVKAGQYKWASIAASLNGTHPESAKKIGLNISSIALTNTPFIMGMEALAASARAADGGVEARWFDTAQTAEEACCLLKEMLCLPVTSTLQDVVAEVLKIQQWVLTGTTPLGVDLEDIVGSMRKILGVPALTPITTVLDSVSQIVQRFVEEQAAEAGQPLPTSDAEPVTSAAVAATGRDEMDIKILAAKHAVRENEEAVMRAIDENCELRTQLAQKLGCKDDNRSLLAAIVAHADAATQLTAVHASLGAKDAATAAAAIAKLSTDSAELAKIQPEITKLRAAAAVEVEKAIESDVALAMKQRGFDDEGLKLALTNLRRTSPEEFAKQFPAKVAPAQQPSTKQLLTQPLVASRNGGEHTARSAASRIQASSPGAQPVLGGEGVIDLGMYPGRNTQERAMSYLLATQEGFTKMRYDDQFQAATQLKKSGRVTDSKIAAS